MLAPEAVPGVSVVIPTRNRLDLLRQTVASVVAQSHRDWELIIVDDASTDETGAWLRSLRDPQIRPILLARHSEQSAARNTGARAARAPVTLSVDDDDLLREDAIAIHVAALRSQPDAIASIGGFSAFDEQGSRQVHRVVTRPHSRVIWPDILFGWTAVVGQCAFRTSALRQINWWDESFIRCTDHEMWARLTRHGPVVLLPDVVLDYRVHAGQWRPADLDALMTEARAKAVRQLEGHERAAGERMLHARAQALAAFDLFLDAKAGAALGAYARLCVRTPQILRSPLTRPMVLRPMSRCLGGSIGIRTGRRLLSWINRARGRELDFSVRSTVESSGRAGGPSPRHAVREELSK